jgi:class 3 adenylate cyclase
MFAGRHISIRVYVGGLFVLLTLAIGFTMAALFYTRMKTAIASTSSELFSRTASLVATSLAAQRAQIRVALSLASLDDLAHARTLAERLASKDVLVGALGASSWAVAAYVGYPNGDFFELRHLAKGESGFGVHPPQTRFVIESIEHGTGEPGRRLIFYDAAMGRIGERAELAYRFDPRTRPWFHAARTQVLTTDPYLFFTTHEVGITLALGSPAGSVFGADVDLENASEELARLRPTPSSVLAITTSDRGSIIAFSDPSVIKQLAGTAMRDRLLTVATVGSPPLAAAFAGAGSSAAEANGNYTDAGGHHWLYRAIPFPGREPGGRGLILITVPEDELFAAAARARTEAVALSALLVLLWIPLALWVAHWIAGPLGALRADAIALRNRDFSDRAPTSTIITEIAEFAETFDSMRVHIREHHQAATRFVPQTFLEQLERADILALELGDHAERTMTILFSDIRSFTALSESMSPQQTFNFVNSYLTRVGPIIRNHGGFIDKYIGDAIMGLFPEHPQSAVDSAIAMQRRVVVYNEERGRAGYAPIAIGIGLHRGNLMLGTIGEELRFETTVIADAVNVASRLESLTKTFGSLILASSTVVDQIDAPKYQTRRLGDVQVMGTTRGITVVEICDADPPAKLAHKLRMANAFESGRVAYANGDFTGAHRHFAAVTDDDADDRAAAYFRDRAATMAAALHPDWDGVEKMEAK